MWRSKSKVEKGIPSSIKHVQWCQEGRCQAWQLGPPPPQIVHGGWSEWSSGEKQCPITPCHITGSISLKAQLRTCTRPAYACNVLASILNNSLRPNNGGHYCKGANIRGLVCGTPTSTCTGLSRQEFGDRLCAAIRNDPNRPDRQLSGLSFPRKFC